MTRIPLFSKKRCLDFLNGCHTDEAVDDFLKDLCVDGSFREAILVASVDLYHKLDDYIAGEIIKSKNLNNIRLTLIMYYIRMSTRTVPFGLFSGVSINSDNNPQSRKWARPDFGWLMRVIKKFEHEYHAQIQYTMNNLAYRKENYLFLPYVTGEPEKQIKLPLPQSQKVLIENEVLISNLRPPLTLENPLRYLIEQLNLISPNDQQKLEKIETCLARYSETEIGEGEAILANAISTMQDLSASPFYVQIDTKIHPPDGILANVNLEEISEFTGFLVQMSKCVNMNIWESYRCSFYKKYGENREIPLYEMIDDELGIGAPASYLHPTNKKFKGEHVRYEVNEKVSSFLWDRFYLACKNKSFIALDEIPNTGGVRCDYADLPPSLDLHLICAPVDGIMKYYFGENVGSTSAGKSFGRFTHLIKEFKDVIDDIKEKEDDITPTDTITCELFYIPRRTRFVNVMTTYSNRDYEMVFYANKTKPEEKNIHIDDVLVGIEQGKFYLKSKRLNKRLLITTNNMLHFNGDANIIRFLKEVTQNGVSDWRIFPWDILFRELTYIPEIRYKNFIIKTEFWKLQKQSFRNFENVSQFIKEFDYYRTRYELPRYIYVRHDGASQLFLDLHNDYCKKIIHRLLRATQHLFISATEKGNNNYCNCEIVVPLIRKHCNKQNNDAMNMNRTNKYTMVSKEERVKVLGSEWVYLKIYGASAWENELIINHILPFTKVILKNIELYFFVRYDDPERHIRLRFKGKDVFYTTNQILLWASNLTKNNVISHFEIGCYEREIERYGGEYGVSIAEEVFFQDSQTSMEILPLLDSNAFSNELIAVVSALIYMRQFGWTIDEQFNWLGSIVRWHDYRSEFAEFWNSNGHLFKHLIETCKVDEPQLLVDIFGVREKAVAKYRSAILKNTVTVSEEAVLSSLIHMSFNRLFGINNDFEKKTLAFARHILYMSIRKIDAIS